MTEKQSTQGLGRDPGYLKEKRLSQGSQDRNAEAQKGWGGTQRSWNPNKTSAVPEKPGQKNKAHKGWEGPREAETRTKLELSLRSVDRKAKHTRDGRDQESPEP